VGRPYRLAQEVDSIILTVVAIEHTFQNKDSISTHVGSRLYVLAESLEEDSAAISGMELM
jgi:hypothetical protein